jgi:hypothetical protein
MKKIMIIIALLCVVGSVWADTITIYTSTIDTGKTLIPNIDKDLLKDANGYSCEYTKDRKGVTITADVKSVNLSKVIIKIDSKKDKVKLISNTATSKALPTPTITPTITIGVKQK